MSTNLSYTFIFKAYDLAVDIIVNIRIPVTVSILNLTLINFKYIRLQFIHLYIFWH